MEEFIFTFLFPLFIGVCLICIIILALYFIYILINPDWRSVDRFKDWPGNKNDWW